MKQIERRRARECAVQALYSWQLSNDNIINIEKNFLDIQDVSDVDIDYFKKIYIGAAINVNELDNLMLPYISRKLKDIGYVELAVLRIAIFELSKLEDIPYKASINEAIELAKIFGAKESHKFINGVLDKVAFKIRSIKDKN